MKHEKDIRAAALMLVIAAAVALAGCVGGTARIAAALLRADAARAAAAAEGEVALGPAIARMNARSRVVERATSIEVRPVPTATSAVGRSAPIKGAAERSVTRIDAVATRTARTAGARLKVKACVKSGLLAAAHSYAGSYIEAQPAPRFELTLQGSIRSCLQAAFPNEAAAVGDLTDALVNALGRSSQQVSNARATGQDYTDWLVYTASLDESDDAQIVETQPEPAYSPVDRSVDDLLVILVDSHAGREMVGAHDWAAAIDNRIAVLRELRGLHVVAELDNARRTLILAMQASLASDRAHASCDQCTTPYDDEATTQKQAFLSEFNGYVESSYGVEVADTEF